MHNSKRHDPDYAGVAVSRDLRQELIDYLGLPAGLVRTINNFVELEAVRARAGAGLPPAEAALFAHGPVLVVAGRLSREKN